MKRLAYLGGAAALLIFSAGWFARHSGSSEALFEPPSRLVEPTPMCPWRDPEGDLRRFFPGADRWQTETRILSGQRLELEKRLGRPPAADENVLHLHQVYRGPQLVGTVLTRRAKGENGAIEVALAINLDKTIRGLRLQRLREPPTVAAALSAENWLGSFVGQSVSSDWNAEPRRAAAPVELAAEASAAAVVDAVRSQLVLVAVAAKAEARPANPHHRAP